jgi:hypothetical protein
MQVSDLVGPMLSALRPQHRPAYAPNPRPFGGLQRLLRDVERAGFRDVCSRCGHVVHSVQPLKTAIREDCPGLDEMRSRRVHM